jgi:hypothetical protein
MNGTQIDSQLLLPSQGNSGELLPGPSESKEIPMIWYSSVFSTGYPFSGAQAAAIEGGLFLVTVISPKQRECDIVGANDTKRSK